MKIKVRVSNKENFNKIHLEEGSTVEDLLAKLTLKPDTIIVLYKNKPIPYNSDLSDNQEITLIKVSSGG